MGSALVETAFDHLVMYYEDEGYFADGVARFVEAGLRDDGQVVVIATPAHADNILTALGRRTPEARRARDDGRLHTWDARAVRDELVVDDGLDPDGLERCLGAWLSSTTGAGHPVSIFGEVVALLWTEGRYGLAHDLEEAWNRLGRRWPFRLLCAYPMGGFADDESPTRFLEVCRQHSSVTTESYAGLSPGVGDEAEVVVLRGDEPGGSID